MQKEKKFRVLLKNKTKLVITVITSLGLLSLLSGCNMTLLDPKGIIAAAEKQLLIDSTLLMLIVVIPVIILAVVIAWKFRASNSQSKYSPNWSHSTILELVWWAIPMVIILILAVMTWRSTHKLSPYRPLDVKGKPMIVQVVALEWKWLFIYPEQDIASVNFLQIPVDVPVRFLITSDAPMNSFAIPSLAGQIYAMGGMQTRLNVLATETGDYRGFSANYSGDGFSGMHFVTRVSSLNDFNQWVNTVKQSPSRLSIDAYNKLAKPSEKQPVEYFSSVQNKLFKLTIMKYTTPGIANPDGSIKDNLTLTNGK